MNYDTLVKLIQSKSVVKTLLDAQNVNKWAVHQKWIVHDFIKLHADALDISIESSAMTKGTVISKTEWCTLMRRHDIRGDAGRPMIKNLLQYYKRLMKYVEDNGGWIYVEYYLKSRGMAAALTSMHSVDLDGYIERVDELSEDQQAVMKYLDEKRLTILAGPGAGKTTTLVHIVRQLAEQGKRVLILMYNVAVKDQFIRRLKELGVTNVLKHAEQKHFKNSGGRQLVVCTIHKYLYECMPYTLKKTSGGKVTFGPANKKYMSEYRWDYCLVDEVQDLDRNLYDGAVNLVNADRFIYAGDYRQNIAGDPDVFRRILDSSTRVHKIRDNHRSYPDIVDILNVYSDSNYPEDVHIEQQAMILPESYTSLVIEQAGQHSEEQSEERSDEQRKRRDEQRQHSEEQRKRRDEQRQHSEERSDEQRKRRDIAHKIVEHLLRFRPGETFIIAPISISKYDFKRIKERVYNYLLAADKNRYRHLHTYNPAEYKSDDMQLRADKDYFITAKSAKGLERKQVIVFNVDDINLYCAHSKYRRIQKDSMISHLYVALSRATHRLVILLDDSYKSKYYPSLNSELLLDHPLKCIFDSRGTPVKECNTDYSNTVQRISTRNLSQTVSISALIDSLVPACNRFYEIEEMRSFKPITVLKDHTYQISDIIGLYIEACIADYYGIIKSKHVCIAIHDDTLEYDDGDTYIYRVRGTDVMDDRAREKLQKYQEYAALMSAHTDKRYAYVAMRLFLLLGEYDKQVENSIGDLFKSTDPDLAEVYSYISNNGSTDSIEHHQSLQYIIHADRSDKSADHCTVLTGEADFVHGSYLYEIKHSSGEEDKHCMQTLLYRMMTGLDTIVINTKRGKIYRVKLNSASSPSYDTLRRIIRATVHTECSKRFPQSYCRDSKLFSPSTRYLISVDDEYRQSKSDVVYYERAAVVYDTVECKVVDTLHLVHRDARENIAVPIIASRDDCHRFHNDPLGTDEDMERRYCEFLKKYSPEESVVVHWAGSEGNNYDFSRVSTDHILKGMKWNCLDIRRVYELYLYNTRSISSAEEKHSSLDSAVMDLFGESMHLLYHRAFDDCIATLLVYISLTTY